MQRKFIAIIGGVVAGIFLPILFTNENQSLDTYLLGGFIATEVIIFVADQVIQGKRHLQDRVERHTKDLYEIYKRMAEIGYTEEKGNLIRTYPNQLKEYHNLSLEEIFQDPDPFQRVSEKYLSLHKEYEYFDFALEHLKHKKYKNIYQHWEKANKIIDEYNSSSKFMELIEQKIRESMSKSFPEFTERKGMYYSDNFFNLRTITNYTIHRIWEFKENPSESILHDLIVDRLNNQQSCICTKGESIQAHLGSNDKEKLDLKKYQTTLMSILTDKEVTDSLEKDNEKRLEIIKEQEEFKKQLQILITKLKAGELIEGKCQIGY